MSDEIKALVERARNRIHDAPLETEYLIDDLADHVEALSVSSENQFVFLDEHPGEGVPFRKVTKDEALKLFHERLTAQAEEIERLNAIVKRVQGAAKTIMHHEGEELARLRKQAQEHHLAMRTLDSEREANALLTDEVERLRARLEITDEITERYDGIACRDETIRLLEQKIAALKAAQEVKA